MLSLAVSPFLAPSAKAVVANTLVKIDGNSTVYWYAADGRRYVFPNPRTFYSWFSPEDLGRVVTISPQELGSMQIGGNVTYRPGVRLVKVTTDPRVYAVSRYGTLRWITSEALAQQLYGQNWAQQVDDVPDDYFTNYRVGDPIYTSSQFNIQFELGQARSPSENTASNGNWPNPPSDPYSSISGTVNLTLSNQNPYVGETVNFVARLDNSSNSASDITLSIFSVTGETLRVCTNSVYCSYDWSVSSNLSGYSRAYFARATHRNGQTRDSNSVTLQVRGVASTSGRPTISTNISSPRIGDTVTLTASVNDIVATDGTLSIIAPNNSVLQNCSRTAYCSYSFVMTETIANNLRSNGGSYLYYSRYTYPSGSRTDSADSARVYAPDTNVSQVATSMTLSLSRSDIRAGENFTVTATINPQTTGAPYYTIRIYDQWNVLQHTCERVRTCVLQQTMSQTYDTSRTYYANATADTGHSISSGNATIQVLQTNQNTNGYLGSSQPGLALAPNPGYITASPLTIYSGTTLTISSDLQYPVPSNLNGIVIKLYQLDGVLLRTCTNVATCSVSKVVTNDISDTLDATLRFKARVEDAWGSYYETAPFSVLVRPAQRTSNPLTSSILSAGIDYSYVHSYQAFTLTAQLNNTTVPTQNIKISWFEASTDRLISYCEGINPCTYTTSYPASGGQSQTVSFYAKAVDRTGTYMGAVQSTPVTITINP